MADHNGSKGQQRRNEVLYLLKQSGRISVQEIVEQLHCSEATARRDLDLLQKESGVIRTIGGARYERYTAMHENSFTEKQDKRWAEKEAIARKVLELIEEGDIVGLSGGTTTFMIAKQMKKLEGITVVTNAINIAMELADSEGIQVVVIGGVLRKKSYELSGPLAEQMIESLHISKTFLGIDGLSIERGMVTYSEMEAHTARMIMKHSLKTFAVFDYTKIEKPSLFAIAPLSEVYGGITDDSADQSYLQLLRNAGLSMHIASKLSHNPKFGKEGVL